MLLPWAQPGVPPPETPEQVLQRANKQIAAAKAREKDGGGGPPDEIVLMGGGHCIDVEVQVTPSGRTLQLLYTGPDTHGKEAVIPALVLFCDPVEQACANPNLDACSRFDTCQGKYDAGDEKKDIDWSKVKAADIIRGPTEVAPGALSIRPDLWIGYKQLGEAVVIPQMMPGPPLAAQAPELQAPMMAPMMAPMPGPSPSFAPGPAPLPVGAVPKGLLPKGAASMAFAAATPGSVVITESAEEEEDEGT